MGKSEENGSWEELDLDGLVVLKCILEKQVYVRAGETL